MKRELFKKVAGFFLLGAMWGFTAAHADEGCHGKMSAEDRAAFQSCAKQVGLTPPERGVKPAPLSADQKSAMDQCLTGAGVSLPPPPPEEGDSST